MAFRFGEFVLDAEARTLTRDGHRLELTPKAFVLLATLIEKRPQALSHAELNDLLWPATFVAHTSLPRVVTELRKALDDERSAPRYLRTVHGFGYSFVAEVTADETRVGPPRRGPVLLWAGNSFGLREGASVIGRSTECEIHVPSARASKKHARVTVRDGVATVEDLGSRNGTFVNGAALAAVLQLHDGDSLTIGPANFLFLEGDPSLTTKGDTSV